MTTEISHMKKIRRKFLPEETRGLARLLKLSRIAPKKSPLMTEEEEIFSIAMIAGKYHLVFDFKKKDGRLTETPECMFYATHEDGTRLQQRCDFRNMDGDPGYPALNYFVAVAEAAQQERLDIFLASYSRTTGRNITRVANLSWII